MKKPVFTRLLTFFLAGALLLPLACCTGSAPAETEPPEAVTSAPESSAATTAAASAVPLKKKDGAKLVFSFDGAGKLSSTDVNTGGGLTMSFVTLSDEQDHTGGEDGRSLKLFRRTETYHRVRLLNCFTPEDVGSVFVITAYVLVPDATLSVQMGVMGIANTDFATTNVKTASVLAKRGEWTKITMEYEHREKGVTAVSFEQPGKTTVAATIYVDDVTVEKTDRAAGSGNDAPGVYSGVSLAALPLDDNGTLRATPHTDGPTGYDTLIFYEKPAPDVKASGSRTVEEIFADLKIEPKKIVEPAKLLSASLSGQQFGSSKVIAVSDDSVPFKQALHIEVKTIPQPNPWSCQLHLPALSEKSFEDGDVLFCVFYMRTLETDAEDGMGQVQLINELPVAPNTKAMHEYVKTGRGAGWQRVCLPYKAMGGATSLCVRLGYAIQTIEIGGYELYNCGAGIDVKDLPTDTIMEGVIGYDDLYDRDVSWRKEAWERIEQIRRGDLTVTVTDAGGSPVEGAEVSVRMLEHDFKFGTAVNTNVYGTSSFADSYRKALSAFFNTAVCETACKWAAVEPNPASADKTFEQCAKLGLTYFRGHTLLWDRPLSKTLDAKGNWIENSSVPLALAQATKAGDRAEIDRLIEEHTKFTLPHFAGVCGEWDIVNELVNNHEIRSRYGNEVLSQWYGWARKYAPEGTKLFINETGITGSVGDSIDEFMTVLDWMAEHDVPFDGIGVQAHFGSFVKPTDFEERLTRLDKYGKELRITEFDMALKMHDEPDAEASFMRDIMILVFSHESVGGFLMWGFSDSSHWLDNAPLFDSSWALKKSGEQFLDLVYHQWWTRESGVTAASGTYTVPAYYGTYEITVAKDGKTTVLTVPHTGSAPAEITVKLG